MRGHEEGVQKKRTRNKYCEDGGDKLGACRKAPAKDKQGIG